jgi:hypothetical protein
MSTADNSTDKKRPYPTASQSDIDLYLGLGSENERENILIQLREEYEALKEVGEDPTYLQGLEHAILLIDDDLDDPEQPEE